MFKAMLQHMYLILTLKHPGTGLELKQKSALYFIMGCYLVMRVIYSLVLGETLPAMVVNIVFVSIICWFLMNMEYKSSFVAYCLCMMMTLFFMSISTLFFGDGFNFLWFFWSLVMIYKVITAVRFEQSK